MIDFHRNKLSVSQATITECPKVTVIGILHALTDTLEFLKHMIDAGHSVPIIFAKPYSKDRTVIESIEKLGIKVEQLDYETIEGTSILQETIDWVIKKSKNPVILIDVGGYFAKPLSEMADEKSTLRPAGVVEVTTFGHNRYVDKIKKIPIPVISVARSPLKDVEAAFVGESTWLAIDKILRNAGMSAFGRNIGVLGYGMIGRRVAAAAQSNGANVRVFDNNSLKLLEARSFKHEVRLSLSSLLQDSEIVISATGNTALTTQEILSARDGIILSSAGSKTVEIDVDGIQRTAISSRRINDLVMEYEMPSKKKVLIVRGGAAVNFLLGSCPDETMDVVFAEIIEGFKIILGKNMPAGEIYEVDDSARKKIASSWLALQG